MKEALTKAEFDAWLEKAREIGPDPDLLNEYREAERARFDAFMDERQTSEAGIEPDPQPYRTRLLDAAQWVIETYWSGKAPEEGPTKELVIEKLQELQNLSRNEAEAVDLVTRHDSRRNRRST